MRWRAVVVAAGLAGAGIVVTPAGASAADLAGLVKPLAGSLGAGFVQVAAGQPFGMATPGPATTTPEGDDPVNYIGYSYQDPLIRGFALNHFSGAGIHIGGELPFMPTTGSVTTSDPSSYASPFDHAEEDAEAGYYAVTLDRYQVRAEMTATPRVAYERFSFPSTATQDNVLLDVARDNDGVQSGSLRVVDDHTIVGSVTGRLGKAFTLWFTARFDRPFVAHGTWAGSALSPSSSAVDGSGAGGWVTFDPAGGASVGVRVGLSWLSADGATRNLDAEAPPSVGFDAVRQAAHDAWNKRLHAIEVTPATGGPTASTFYTALYHSMLLPVVFDDADGDYLGFDGVVHHVPTGHRHRDYGRRLRHADVGDARRGSRVARR
jgi:putative alpha-1,2-mannosidase